MSKIPRVLETTFETYSVESKLGEGGTCPASTILVPLLRQLTAIADPQKRSIKLVGDYLSQHGAEPAEIVPVLKHLNRLRQGYPVHGDRADSVLEAHEFFRLPYPVEDWRVAWRTSLLKLP